MTGEVQIDATIQEISTEVQNMVKEVFTQLKGAPNLPDRKVPLFFPNGIELISLVVTVGPKDKPLLNFSATVAGAAGKPLTRPEEATSDDVLRITGHAEHQ